MPIPQKIQQLAKKVREAVYGKDVRDAIAEAIEESGKTAGEAREITEALLDGSFDQGLLDTEIREKLVQLEQDYAPELTNLGAQLAQKATKTDVITPKRHVFGEQLSRLKQSLANPLEQVTGIVFVGDSITWGRTLPDNAIFNPRNGTLSDPRDNFVSKSFVNEFKRYIGSQYAFGATPTLFNWQASPSGEAVVEYTTQNILYPRHGDFSLTTVGSNMTVAEVQSSTSLTGYQLQLNDLLFSGGGSHTIKFKFTGDEFDLSFGIVNGEECWYDLLVDGQLIGSYLNAVGVDGFTPGNDRRRRHTFPYIRDKFVEIRTNRNGDTTIYKRLRIEAIIVNKRIRITNQGIIGATTDSYKSLNITLGQGEAITKYDNYVFCQLGTNDRIISTNKPRGANTYRKNLQEVIDTIQPLSDVILMCANPAENESVSTYSFNMQNVRNVVYRTAKDNNIDMIDNHAIFNGMNVIDFTSDGLHPNTLGHSLIARNIINSLEYS